MAARRATRDARREGLRVLSCVLIWLFVFDLASNYMGRPPLDPRVEPTALQRYLDYGRTVEAKLRHMVRANPAQSAPIASSGWLVESAGDGQPARPSHTDHVLIAAYGQSFTARLLRRLHERDPRFEARFLGGPGAPISHSHAAFLLDRGRHAAKVAMIGVLASSLPLLASMTNMTAAFEAPQPFTYPRYVLRNGELETISPRVSSFAELRDALADADMWKSFRAQLREHDLAYDPTVFEADIFDHSALARIVRRGAGQKHHREAAQRFVDESGFTNYAGILDVAEALFADFAKTARADGMTPLVVLIHDRGYQDFLVRALGPRLEQLGVSYFSTHEIAPATQEGLFLKDGHFRPEVDRKLAAGLHALLAATWPQPRDAARASAEPQVPAVGREDRDGKP